VFQSVLIVDDHRAFRAWVHAFLEAEGYRVVGEAADGATAIREASSLRPDLVLLDVHLPDVDGFKVANQVAELVDPPAVVLISSRDDVEFGTRVIESGVRGFISKAELTGDRLTVLLHEGE
jgi:DNA-binding NarL/FixJ family response regulator